MATKISAISNALLLIGDTTINSLDDGSERANVAASLYDGIYYDALSSHPWSFARNVRQLAKINTEEPLIKKWRNVFQLPANLVRIIRFEYNPDYEIYGDRIYCNNDELILDYIQKVDETTWPPYFEKFMEYSLAAEFAIPIRENTNVAQLMKQLALQKGQNARAIDSTQRIQRPIQSMPFLQVRN